MQVCMSQWVVLTMKVQMEDWKTMNKTEKNDGFHYFQTFTSPSEKFSGYFTIQDALDILFCALLHVECYLILFHLEFSYQISCMHGWICSWKIKKVHQIAVLSGLQDKERSLVIIWLSPKLIVFNGLTFSGF